MYAITILLVQSVYNQLHRPQCIDDVVAPNVGAGGRLHEKKSETILAVPCQLLRTGSHSTDLSSVLYTNMPLLLISRILVVAALALALTSCNECNDPSSPQPTVGLPDLMYTHYQRDVSPQIFTAKADGSGQRPWSTTSGYVTNVGWLMSSPRSGRIAFITGSQYSGPVSLVISDLNGENAVVLESDVEFDDILYPVLSPDARTVVVTKHRQSATADIIVYDVATKTKKQITDDIQSESQVFFGPSSSEIAYYTSDNRINMIGVDGSNKRTIVSDAYSSHDYSCFLDFSPTGDRMVYMRRRVSDDEPDLAILTMSTGVSMTFRTSTTEIFGHPSWSPDGTSIAYVHGSNGSERTVLSVSPVDSPSTVKDVMDVADHYPQFPQWSANGQYISATVTVGEGMDNGTYSVRVFDLTSVTSTLIGTDLVLSFWIR